MMFRKLKKIMISAASMMTLCASVLNPDYAIQANAKGIDDGMIVVSLGDSYSSGEGIEPFYGQEQPIQLRVDNYDWLAHRSEKSWPGQLKVPGIPGTMADYRLNRQTAGNCKWYFVASSGATTKHIKDEKQDKVVKQGMVSFSAMTKYLPEQLKVFDGIEGTVDYVTMTIGGNDVGFSKIMQTCATTSSYLDPALRQQLKGLWDNIETYKNAIRKTYLDVSEAAGPQAHIIVAGYPKLLDPAGSGFLVSSDEAEQINASVSGFNNVLESLVEGCRSIGVNISFVDVMNEFDSGSGHSAYADDPWINPIMIGSRGQDLQEDGAVSSYSIHPNEKGAQAYARCVNAEIERIEAEEVKTGVLSGKVCKASDRVTPLEDATAKITGSDGRSVFYHTGPDGKYSVSLPEGDYTVTISAEGYIDFQAFVKVTADNTVYTETFLMIEGGEEESGTASGTITDALTGNGIGDVVLNAREGWNNTAEGDVIATASTDSDGNYSMTLPLGNYTLEASKAGYITDKVNVIVQPGETGSQNGTMTPIVLGDSFRIVLTWGENPRDLDSHVAGILSNGNPFEVYYGHKRQYDGENEVCNLDVDDTSGYGPETVTLNITGSEPYYYYVHKYAGYGTVGTSEAQVKVYQGEQLAAQFNVPTDQGDGRYWNVFAIKDGRMIVQNTITADKDLGYVYPSVTNAVTDLLTSGLEENISKEEIGK